MKLKEAAVYTGVHPKTLQRLDREGKLKPVRSKTNRRSYTKEQLKIFFNIQEDINVNKKVIAYCRVSSNNQKPDLENQIQIIKQYAKQLGINNFQLISEIGGGLNFKRKQFNNILNQIEKKEVACLIIAHKDRLVRFGYDWFANFCLNHNCEIKVLDDEKLSPEQEMVQDLMTIIHCFSSRLYGLRNYKNKLKKEITNDKKS